MPKPSPTPLFDQNVRPSQLERWRCRPAGHSRAAFCREHGVRPWILAYDLRRRRRPFRPGFVEIVAASTPAILAIVVGHARIRIAPDFNPTLLRQVVLALSPANGAAY